MALHAAESRTPTLRSVRALRCRVLTVAGQRALAPLDPCPAPALLGASSAGVGNAERAAHERGEPIVDERGAGGAR